MTQECEKGQCCDGTSCKMFQKSCHPGGESTTQDSSQKQALQSVTDWDRFSGSPQG